MELDRDKLDRFVDGELPPGEMERIAAVLTDSPEQNAYVVRQESLRNRLREGFHALDGSIPERLIQAARTAPASWRWRLRAAQKPNRLFRWLAPACATLLLGFVAGVSLVPQGDLVTSTSGQVIAQGALDKALDGQQLPQQGGSGLPDFQQRQQCGPGVPQCRRVGRSNAGETGAGRRRRCLPHGRLGNARCRAPRGHGEHSRRTV